MNRQAAERAQGELPSLVAREVPRRRFDPAFACLETSELFP